MRWGPLQLRQSDFRIYFASVCVIAIYTLGLYLYMALWLPRGKRLHDFASVIANVESIAIVSAFSLFLLGIAMGVGCLLFKKTPPDALVHGTLFAMILLVCDVILFPPVIG